jgi:HK97 family phage portal protein
MLGITENDVMGEPYKKSDLVYICISTTAKAISQVPLIVVRNSGSDGEYKPLSANDPWSQLFSRPNYITDRYSFVESIITYLLHDGEVFIIPFPPGLGPPGSLWVVRNKFIRPVKDPKSNLLVGWLYNQTGQFTAGNTAISSEGIPLHVDEVARVYLFNPYDPLKGMSPLEAGKMSIVVDYKASFYTSVFFDEGASPGGVISTENKLGDKQFSRVKEQFEARHQGFKKAHRIAVLEQGLKYTQTGLTQKDMEFGELRKLSAERIYQIFGMKKAVVSVMEDVNYATSREEIKLWWEGTNLPLMSLTTSALNFILFNQNSDLKLMFDITTVAALKEALKEKVDTGYKMWQMGFTANEINRRLDMGFGNKAWRDTWYVPVNLQPVERALNPPKPTVPALPTPTTPPPALPPPKPPKALTEGGDEKLSDKDEIRGEQSWNNFIHKTAALEEKFEKKVTRVFMDMRKRSLDSLFKSTKAPKDLDDELFSEDSKNISRFTDPLYGDAVIVGFTTMLDDIGSSIVFSVSDPEALAFLAMKNIQIKGIIQTIKDQIRVELMEAYEKGDTIDEIATRIRNVFNMSNSRAKIIARTEILGAAGEGRSLAINRSGYKEKRWFTAMDERVRPQHRAMHGRTIKTGNPWVMPDGSSLRFPGDSRGPAHQVISCRCIETVVFESHFLLEGN